MSLFDTIFPSHTCLVCRSEINQSKQPLVCDVCIVKLPRHKKICDKCGCGVGMHAFVCDKCQKKKWHFTLARSVFCYDDVAVELVLKLKYNSEGDVAKFVAPFLGEAITEYGIKADVIIPVPLTPRRTRERGYNQAGLIAAEVSKLIGVPVVDDFLVRVKHTKAQKKMTLKQRQENLKGAFNIKPPYSTIKDKRVLLIDDVLTTGTTVDECARVLKKAKPKSVEVLTIASVGKTTFSQ